MGHRLKLWRLRFARSWVLLLGISGLVTAVAAVCQRYDFLGMHGAETSAYDDGLTTMTRWTTRPRQSKDIEIVAIDDRTFQGVAGNPSYAQAYGSWPYARIFWTRVLERLTEDGARAVVFDATMDERNSDPGTDQQLADLIEKDAVPFYLGVNVNARTSHALPRVTPAPRPRKPGAAPASNATASASDDSFGSFAAFSGPPAVSDTDAALALSYPVEATGGLEIAELGTDAGLQIYPQRPIDPLLPVARGFGLVKMEDDDDGKMRRTSFAYSDGINDYVMLPVAVAADLFGAAKVTLAPRGLALGMREIPIDADGTAELAYWGDFDQCFHSISVFDVLEDWTRTHATPPLAPRIPAGTFKGKVAMIAGIALGTADVKATPFSSNTPGVVKQATMLQNLLDGRFIVEVPFWVNVLITFLVVFASVTLLVVIRSTPLEIAWPFVLYYGFFLVTGLFLVHGRIHILSAMPAWAASFASLVVAVHNHAFGEKDRHHFKEVFNRHLHPHQVEELVEQKELPSLAGERRDVTLLLTDIPHFTELSNRYAKDPHALVKFLNRYHTRVTEVLLEHGGCVTKYRGDQVVCLFGDPLPQADHALRAAKAALAVIAATRKMALEMPDVDRASVATRIGIHSGEMFVGNFGSDHHVDYGVVGDGMTAAHHVERANHELGTEILLSEDTLSRVKGKVVVQPKGDKVLLEGHPPVALYELTGLLEGADRG